MDWTIPKSAFRRLALRRIATSIAFFLVLLTGAVAIIQVAYQMMLFAIIALTFSGIALAYGIKSARQWWNAETTHVHVVAQSLRRRTPSGTQSNTIVRAILGRRHVLFLLDGKTTVDIPLTHEQRGTIEALLTAQNVAVEIPPLPARILIMAVTTLAILLAGLIALRFLAFGALVGLVYAMQNQPALIGLALVLIAIGLFVRLIYRFTVWVRS